MIAKDRMVFDFEPLAWDVGAQSIVRRGRGIIGARSVPNQGL